MNEIAININRDLPKVSIIIPVYNVELYIAECLQSVMRQTYSGEIECIIVDDCGKDRSIEIAEQIIEDYTIENQKSKIKNQISFHILHHEHNRGLSAARNTGTDAATGDYIYYLDSDDYISNDCIAALVQPLSEYLYDMVIGRMETFGNEHYVLPLQQRTGAFLSNKDVFEAFYGEKRLYVMACNKLVKRNLFRTNDLTFLEGQIHEDDLWTYKSSIALESLFVQDQVTYHYRVREGSIMRKQDIDKRAKSCYASIDYVLSHPAKINQELMNRIIIIFMNDYLLFSIQIGKNTLREYVGLRKRIDYHPLRDWNQGKLTLKDVKHRFAYFLPPYLGYVYLKIRKIKNQAFMSFNNTI